MELAQGQDPQVKAFESKYLPGIEAHMAMLYPVAKSVTAPDRDLRPATPPTVTGVSPSPAMSVTLMPATTGTPSQEG